MRRSISRSVMFVCASITSLNCFPMFTTGFSAFMLLWKTVDISAQRSGRISSSLARVMSLPSKITCPLVMVPGGSSSRSTAVPSVDLPEPDSPTNPTISPASMVRFASFTAWKGGRFFVM